MKKIFIGLLTLLMLIAGCNQADTVSRNLSQEADQFRVLRRVVFYNGITDSYMLTIEGFCSLGNSDTSGERTITCKTGINDEYKKHFLGLSDNVTYFVEQIEGATVDPNHYKVIFRPTEIVPDFEIDVD